MSRFTIALLAALLVAACARITAPPAAIEMVPAKATRTYARVLICQDVDHHTVTLGRARAEAAAASGLNAEIGNLKSHMLRSGLGHLRLVKRQINCVGAPLAAAGEHYCVATARVCANRAAR